MVKLLGAAPSGTTDAATKGYVDSQVSGVTFPVTSVASKTGAVSLVASDVSGAAPLASPTFTGTPAAPTATAGTNTTQIATTAFAYAGFALKANLASPTFTGTPAAPTATAGTNTTQVATTAFVTGGIATGVSGLAPLASPTFTGSPVAPTVTAGDSSTKLATTAFVTGGIATGVATVTTSSIGAVAVGSSVADVSIVGFGAATVRAAGTGDFPFGVKLQRTTVFTSVTFRVATADASGNLVVGLYKNGSAVSGTSTTIASASQVTGGTSTGSWSFSAGDILTVQITAVGTTPGNGLIADITGLA